MRTLIILGSGFDISLGLGNSCAEFSKSHFCPAVGNEYWNEFENKLREEVIKWYAEGKDEEKAKQLNLLWQEYTRNISWFFTEKSDEYKCDNRTCAYLLLKRLKPNDKSKVYTFNYTNPYEYVDIPQAKEFIFLHGKHFRDTFEKELMVMSQGHNIIFGIDKCIPEDGVNNPFIYPMVKQHHSMYKETDMVNDLSTAKNVIFYGFSMGETDYNYFERFFNTINDGVSNCKNIYYVTYRRKDFKQFQDNLRKKGFKSGNINLIPVYTKYGCKNRNFRKMLREI